MMSRGKVAKKILEMKENKLESDYDYLIKQLRPDQVRSEEEIVVEAVELMSEIRQATKSLKKLKEARIWTFAIWLAVQVLYFGVGDVLSPALWMLFMAVPTLALVWIFPKIDDASLTLLFCAVRLELIQEEENFSELLEVFRETIKEKAEYAKQRKYC